MIDYKFHSNEQCEALVYIRDTYRYTGRGKSGFSMHFNKRQCKRKKTNQGYCKQHAKIKGIVK